jgi:AraC-like DNA-binding protein
MLELYAGAFQVLCSRRNVPDLPPQHCILRLRHFRHDGNPQHGPLRVEHQRKSILTDEVKAKLIAIEFLRADGVSNADESHYLVRTKHRMSRHENSVHQKGCVAKPPVRHNISLMRHGLITDYDPKAGVSISTLAYEYPANFDVPEHAHGSNQLIYATRGVMQVSASQSFWLIPPHFAIWIPGLTSHRIRMSGAVSMRTLYLRRSIAARELDLCSVLHVTPLLRELVVEAVRLGQLRISNHLHRALRDLLAAELRKAYPIPASVTLPRDPRALAVAQAVMSSQAESPSLRRLCADAGASVRTIERTFRREVGMSFETWRRQVRLVKGMELLVAGRPVKEVAFDVGYRQPSAFVEMFRQTLGVTPRAWASALARA